MRAVKEHRKEMISGHSVDVLLIKHSFHACVSGNGGEQDKDQSKASRLSAHFLSCTINTKLKRNLFKT